MTTRISACEINFYAIGRVGASEVARLKLSDMSNNTNTDILLVRFISHT